MDVRKVPLPHISSPLHTRSSSSGYSFVLMRKRTTSPLTSGKIISNFFRSSFVRFIIVRMKKIVMIEKMTIRSPTPLVCMLRLVHTS